jgi:hypothetical protein
MMKPETARKRPPSNDLTSEHEYYSSYKSTAGLKGQKSLKEVELKTQPAKLRLVCAE